MFVVDTNILVYAANQRAREHRAAAASLGEWVAGSAPWFVTWSILYEFLRVTTHPLVFESPLKLSQALEFLQDLLDSPSLGILTETERHIEVVRELAKNYPQISGNAVHDLHMVALMREHGVTEIRTADTSFHQFRFLRVLNPVRS